MSNKQGREVATGIPMSHAVEGHVGKMFDSSYDAQAFPAGGYGSKSNKDLPTSLEFGSPYPLGKAVAGNVDSPGWCQRGSGEVCNFLPGQQSGLPGWC